MLLLEVLVVVVAVVVVMVVAVEKLVVAPGKDFKGAIAWAWGATRMTA